MKERKEVCNINIEEIWCRIKKFMTVKTFSKFDMFIFLAFILFWAFMETDLFQSWHSYFRLVYFAGGLAIGWASGYMSLRKVKSALEKAENIIKNPKVHIDKKYQVACDAIHEGCFYLGVVFELYNREQGTTPRWKEKLEKEEVKEQ